MNMKKFFLFFGFFFMSIGFSFSQSQLPTITLTPLAEAPKQIEFMSGNEIWFMSDGNVLVNSQNIGNPLPIDEVLVKGFVDDNEVILTSDSSVYYHPDFSGTSWANVFTANSGDRIVEILEYQGKTLVITTGGKVYQDVRTTSIIPNQIIGFAFVGTDAIGDGYYTEGAGIDNSTGELVILHTPTRAYTRNTIVSGSLISQIDIGDFNNIVVGSVSSPFYCGLTMDAVGSWGMDTRVMSFDGSGLREIVGVGGDYVELDMFGGKLLCSGSNGLNGIMLGGQILFINPPAEIFLLDVSGQVTISSFTNLFKVWGRPSCVVVHGDSIVFSLNNVWLEAPWFNNFTTGAYVKSINRHRNQCNE